MQPVVTNDNNSDSPANKDFLPNQPSQEAQFEQLSEHLHLLDLFPGVFNALFEEYKDRNQEEEEDLKDKEKEIEPHKGEGEQG